MRGRKEGREEVSMQTLYLSSRQQIFQHGLGLETLRASKGGLW